MELGTAGTCCEIAEFGEDASAVRPGQGPVQLQMILDPEAAVT